ncbi:MAG: FapA family protein [Spirochaetota bacterium]
MKYIIFYFDIAATRIFNEKTDAMGNASMVLSSPNNFVSGNEIVAKIVNVNEPEELDGHLDEGYNFHMYQKYLPVKAGEGIIFDPVDSVFKSSEYGFASYNKDKSSIILLNPLRIQKDKMKAFYIVFPTKFNKIPTVQEIEENLIKNKIYTIIDKNTLAHDLESVDLNTPQVKRIKVAQGKEPKNGVNEHFLPLIDFEKKAGKMLEDGSIDFKEIGAIIEIKQRQAILKRIPAETTQDGFNIYGNKVEGTMNDTDGYSVGENIVPSVDPNIYTSTIDGCLDVNKRTVSVSPISFIKSDVGYESGNIDFHGTVHVKGSVLPGFTVKAKGDVIVDKAVTDAVIEADGNITVKLGIEGKGLTKVVAGGNVKAKFIFNSYVEAMGTIQVDDSIINSSTFSNDKIIVTDKHGKIIGGETTAFHSIHAKISGVPNENKTILTVGKNIYVEKELADIKSRMLPIKNQIDEITQKLKTSFGEEIFSNPKGLIAILPPIKKKPCLALLSELSSKNKELKVLSEEYKIKENELIFEVEPVIEISSKVYPGTFIKIKKIYRMIDEELHNVKFFEDPEQKIIRFTSAV